MKAEGLKIKVIFVDPNEPKFQHSNPFAAVSYAIYITSLSPLGTKYFILHPLGHSVCEICEVLDPRCQADLDPVLVAGTVEELLKMNGE